MTKLQWHYHIQNGHHILQKPIYTSVVYFFSYSLLCSSFTSCYYHTRLHKLTNKPYSWSATSKNATVASFLFLVFLWTDMYFILCLRQIFLFTVFCRFTRSSHTCVIAFFSLFSLFTIVSIISLMSTMTTNQRKHTPPIILFPTLLITIQPLKNSTKPSILLTPTMLLSPLHKCRKFAM